MFISGFDRDTNNDDLKHLFRNICTPKRIKVVRDIITGMSKQYAFIEFLSRDDADYVMDKLSNGVTLKDKKVL